MRVIVTDLSGAEHELEPTVGLSVMKTIKAANLDDLQAICGGACSCSTCQVYVDPAWLDKLTPMEDRENDVLDCSDVRQPNSRLSCQIAFRPDLDGLRVTIAPSD
jgi:2Fe-2S ferredoxin